MCQLPKFNPAAALFDFFNHWAAGEEAENTTLAYSQLLGIPVHSIAIQYNCSAINSAFTEFTIIMLTFLKYANSVVCLLLKAFNGGVLLYT